MVSGLAENKERMPQLNNNLQREAFWAAQKRRRVFVQSTVGPTKEPKNAHKRKMRNRLTFVFWLGKLVKQRAMKIRAFIKDITHMRSLHAVLIATLKPHGLAQVKCLGAVLHNFLFGPRS